MTSCITLVSPEEQTRSFSKRAMPTSGGNNISILFDCVIGMLAEIWKVKVDFTEFYKDPNCTFAYLMKGVSDIWR